MNSPKPVCKLLTTLRNCLQISLNMGEYFFFEYLVSHLQLHFIFLNKIRGWKKSEIEHLIERHAFNVFKICFSEPTHNGEPTTGFLPIQNDQVNFLDVTNDGLKMGVNVNQRANEFWARIEEQASSKQCL